MENRQNNETQQPIPIDRTIERFEELLIELQHIFLDIYSNYKRADEEEE